MTADGITGQRADAEDELSSLIVGCASGRDADLARLYRLQSSRLFGVALRILGERQAAADAVHDAFVQVWQRASQYNPERGAAQGWLIALVRYRALDQLRRRGREMAGEALPEAADDGPDALRQLMDARDGEALHRCLLELAPDRRALIVDAFVAGLSHTELAERRSLPLGTVKSWIRRGLSALKACLTL